MANSTTNLDGLTPGQGSKEVSVNALFDAASVATLFGRRASTTAALTWGYYGGNMLVAGVVTAIANGTVAMTGSATNYIECDTSGVVYTNTSAFTTGRTPLYSVVCGAASVTSYTDKRVMGSAGPVSLPASTTSPSAPATGALGYTDSSSGLDMAAQVASDGTAYAFDPWRGDHRRERLFMMNNASSAPVAQGATLNATLSGYVGGGGIANTSYYTQWVRPLAQSNAGAGSSASMRFTSDIWRGDAAGQGGFLCSFLFSCHTLPVTGRLIVGLFNNTSALSNQDPSANTDMVGVGWDSSDTHLQFMVNDASGTATKTDLGANFPANTTQTDVYLVTLYQAPNGSSIYYSVKRLNTGHATSSSASTNLPTNTALLTPHMWCNNGSTASAVTWNPMKMYILTPY